MVSERADFFSAAVAPTFFLPVAVLDFEFNDADLALLDRRFEAPPLNSRKSSPPLC
jgi:hypothetical protein